MELQIVVCFSDSPVSRRYTKIAWQWTVTDRRYEYHWVELDSILTDDWGRPKINVS